MVKTGLKAGTPQRAEGTFALFDVSVRKSGEGDKATDPPMQSLTNPARTQGVNL